MIELVEHLNVLKDLETYIENNSKCWFRIKNRKKLSAALETLNLIKIFFEKIEGSFFILEKLHAMRYTINEIRREKYLEARNFDFYKLLLEKLNNYISDYNKIFKLEALLSNGFNKNLHTQTFELFILNML